MKENLFQIKFIFFLLVSLAIQSHAISNQPEEKDIRGIVQKMSLEQKAQLLIGTGMHLELPDSIKSRIPGFGDQQKEETEYSGMVDKVRQYVPGAAGNTAEFPELGITSQVLVDGPAGLRISPRRKGSENTYYCTAFPIATLLASSWDTELVENIGKAMGNEVLEYGADVILGPALNLQRDPLCGRNFEYYSEDPLVSGKMAAAMARGIQSNGVGTSIKHFAANNQETARLSVDAIISQRALRELYLKGFEIAVKEGKPRTVMSSYNKINGTYASESYDLLTKILRDDWGFEGYVMTDWGGGSDLAAQMKAGNDLIMPGSPQQIEKLVSLVKNGELDEKILDKNVERILRGMLQSPRYRKYKPSNQPDLKAHAEITRKAGAEGMILLKNNDATLPLAKSVKTVAAFGNASYEFISGGTGSGDVNEAYTVSLIQGLENAGLKTDAQLQEIYRNYIREERAKQPKPRNFLAALLGGMQPVNEMNVNPELAAKMAENSDLALIVIGRNAGEGEDRKAEAGDFYLSSAEKEMIKNVTDAFHKKGKKAVVVLNIAGVIETASWRDLPDAILCAWQPGQEGGNSVTDVLTGKVNPSGKLAVSFPIKYEDSSTAKNFPGNEIKTEGAADNTPDRSGFSFMRRIPWEVVYQEDIFVGYRYYQTFEVPVAYEFGYGLSYTGFEYVEPKMKSKNPEKGITFSVEVKNTGKIAGREVVQVYASKPDGKLQKPAVELVAFDKTKLLAPGEKETLEFSLKPFDLASFDAGRSAWIVEAGEYTLQIGASSKDIRGKTGFKIRNEIILETVSKALAPQREIQVLSK